MGSQRRVVDCPTQLRNALGRASLRSKGRKKKVGVAESLAKWHMGRSPPRLNRDPKGVNKDVPSKPTDYGRKCCGKKEKRREKACPKCFAKEEDHRSSQKVRPCGGLQINGKFCLVGGGAKYEGERAQKKHVVRGIRGSQPSSQSTAPCSSDI